MTNSLFKKWLISLCLIVHWGFEATKCNAQFYFNINRTQDIDSTTSSSWGMSIIDLDKDSLKLNISLASGKYPNNNYAKSITYNVFNDSAFAIWSRIDGTITSNEFNPIRNSFLSINDSTYALGCVNTHYNNSISDYDTIRSGLIYFNKLGDTLYSKWFGQSVKFIMRGFERIDNNIFFLGAYFDNSTGHSKSYIAKTDLYGNLIWTKTLFGNPNYGNGSGGICKVLYKGYLVCGIYNSYEVGPVHYADCGIYRLDTNGNLLWYKKLFNNTNGGCFKLSEDGSGNYFLSGNLDTLINTTDYPHNGYISKIDSSANIIWMHVFNEIPHILKNMWQFRVLPDGDLIFCGERLESIGSGIHVGWMCRMDSSGVIKWEHYYKQNDSSNYNCLAEIKQMPDGGFIATGTCFDSVTKKQSAWLIRTDSNGCLVPGCVAPNAIEIFPEQKMNVILFPNPSNGDFAISYNIPLTHDITIKVIDITGRVVKNQHESKGVYKSYISLQQPKGIYLVQLIGGKGEIFYSSKVQID